MTVIRQCGPLRLCGISRRYSMETRSAIPALWAEFGPHIGSVPGEIAGACYGMSHGFDQDGFAYMAGVAVGPDAVAPEGMTIVEVPEQQCAVFEHDGHISGFQASFDAAIRAVDADPQVVAVPGFEIEVYDSRFNGMTGEGVVEIRLPVANCR